MRCPECGANLQASLNVISEEPLIIECLGCSMEFDLIIRVHTGTVNDDQLELPIADELQ